jgi:hypothetical protein
MEKILTCIKKHCFTIALLLCIKATITTAFAQADSIGINYQAIARDINSQPFSDTIINVKFSIWDALSGGTMDYSEEHLGIQTNKYGLFTLVIGNGTNATSDFEDITWATTNKYLQVEIDLVPNGYIQMPGRTRFQGVPYARASYIAATALDGWKTTGNNNFLQPAAFLGTTSNDKLIIKTNSDTSIVIAPSGNVEITRGNILIKNSTVAANEIEFNGAAPADIVAHSMLNIGTETAHPIQIKTNNSAKVIIDTLGNVGIGTQTPTAKLDVAGTVRITDTLKVEDKIKITDGTEGAGKILTSDATGLASWETLSLGTVTQVTADSLLPLFTTQVQNDNTTPHIEFTLENANAYTVFGNNTGTSATPTYFNPALASPLFQNQGATNTLLHGNGAGAPSWGQIVNADITNGTIDLGTKVTGTLPITNGGTNAITIGNAGSVAYSNGTAYNFTSQGTDGQVLESAGIGTPVWRKRVLNISGDSILTATTTDTSNYTLSVAMNSNKYSGAVLRGDQYPNMVWKTDSGGNPAWRTDSSGVSYVMGTGLTLFGNMINSTWTQSGNNIYNNNTANVGIGTNTPVNKLDVAGGVAIGNGYAGTTPLAPADGAIIKGKVGIGTNAPIAKLEVTSNAATEIVGRFSNTNFASTLSTLVATSAGTTNAHAIESVTTGTGDAVNATNTGNGRAGTFRITNASSAANTALYASSNVATSGKAAHFVLTSATNSAPSLLAETAGSGNSIEATNTGTGRAGRFEITNSGSPADAFFVSSNGTGKGGVFKLTNALNPSEALVAETNGTGRVASFVNTNAANTSDAVYITTNGGTTTSGSKALSASNTGQGNNVSNYGGYFESTGSGTGNNNIAGYFSATGGSNNYAGIFANGNVGIGTTAPTSPLTVQTKSGTELEFVSTGTNADISANAQFNIGSTTSTLNFLTNSSYRLTVDFAGNVGVGTTSPTALFHVAGAIRVGVGASTTGSLLFNNATNTNTLIIRSGVTSSPYTLTLPIAAPTSNNQVLASTTGGVMSWESASSLGAWSSTGNTGTVASTNFIGTTDAVDFVARTNNIERLRITSGGNVGIGTSAPNEKLTIHYVGGTNSPFKIVNSSNASNTLQITSDHRLVYSPITSSSSNLIELGLGVPNIIGTGSFVEIKPASVDASAYLLNVKEGASSRFVINGDGNIGIGTATPASSLHLVYNSPTISNLGTIIRNTNSATTAISSLTLINDIGYSGGISMNSSTNSLSSGLNGMNIGTNNPAKLQLGTNAFPRVTIDTIGNVGIATVQPVNRLDVNGALAIGSPFAGLITAPVHGAIISGNVGIGTSNVVNKLDVEGGVAIGTLYSGNITAPANGLIVQGNVGMGVSNALNKLDVGGAIAVGSTYANSNLAPTNGAIIEGNVGIGTASPVHKLHVFGGSTLLNPNSATTTALILKGDQSAINHVASDGTLKWYSGLKSDNGGTADNYVIMGSALNPDFVLTQTGSVGIGTASPTSLVKMHLYNNVNYANELKIENPNVGGFASSMLSFYNNTSSAFINFGSSANNTYAGNNGLAIGTVPAGKVQFYTNNTARVTIDATGNVGIGTETPSTNSRLAIKDGHLQSQQTTSPILASLNTSAQSLSNATDIAGNISFSPSFNVTGSVTILYNKSYTTPPIVTISPTNANSAADMTRIWVTSGATSFTINFNATFDTSAHTFSYHVIETQ